MADKKKLSVAEILAAARKADSSGGDEEPEASISESDTADNQAESEASSDDSGDERAAPVKPMLKDGARLSVSEMLSAARGETKSGAAKKSPKPTPPTKSLPPKASADSKTAPKQAASKPAAPKPAAKGASGPRDTASILAAARKGAKPGPVSKAEAAAYSAAVKKPATRKIEVPPMPVRPSFAKSGQPAEKAATRSAKGASAGAGADRRGFLEIGFGALAAVFGIWGLAAARFMFPNVLNEPPSRFKIGFPSDFPAGSVQTKFKAQFAVWIVNTDYDGQPQIAALSTVCTHLGCTPNWLESEQKYKCPCHGSGFYKDGINFEGPAPRPLERYAIRIADDGQIEVDKSRKFQEELGQWADPASYIPA